MKASPNIWTDATLVTPSIVQSTLDGLAMLGTSIWQGGQLSARPALISQDAYCTPSHGHPESY